MRHLRVKPYVNHRVLWNLVIHSLGLRFWSPLFWGLTNLDHISLLYLYRWLCVIIVVFNIRMKKSRTLSYNYHNFAMM